MTTAWGAGGSRGGEVQQRPRGKGWAGVVGVGSVEEGMNGGWMYSSGKRAYTWEEGGLALSRGKKKVTLDACVLKALCCRYRTGHREGQDRTSDDT